MLTERQTFCLRFLTTGPAEEGRCCCSLHEDGPVGGVFWENFLPTEGSGRCLFLQVFCTGGRGLACCDLCCSSARRGCLQSWRDVKLPLWPLRLWGKSGLQWWVEGPRCMSLTLESWSLGAALRGRSLILKRWRASSVEVPSLSSQSPSSSSESDMRNLTVRWCSQRVSAEFRLWLRGRGLGAHGSLPLRLTLRLTWGLLNISQ